MTGTLNRCQFCAQHRDPEYNLPKYEKSLDFRKFLVLGNYTNLPGGIPRTLLFKNRKPISRTDLLGENYHPYFYIRTALNSRSRGRWSFFSPISKIIIAS